MKLSALRSIALSYFVVLLGFATIANGQDQSVSNELSSSFKKVELAKITSASTESLSGTSRSLRFSFEGKAFELRLASNDLRAPGYKAENTGSMGVTTLPDAPVTTFRGSVSGEDGSEVRLSIRGSKIEGYFRTSKETLFIEPASKYANGASANESVIYRSEDSLVDNSFACNADVPTRIKMGNSMVAGEGALAPQALKKFDVATEADLEWVNIFGSPTAANEEILGILNMVEGTFIAELGLRVRVTFQHTWTTGDPYASASGASGILTNFRNYWNANYSMVFYPRNTAHLFTAKSNALSQGIAYIGVVCQNASASYGLSGYLNWAPGKFLVPAHELGHNLGGQHAEAAQSCANTLMNAQLSGSTPMSFCSFSQSQINTFIASSGACLLPVTSKRFDFDGDNRADLALFRPAEGNWYVRRSNGGFATLPFGLPGDKPVTADYDADGRTDAAVFRNGVWWRLNSASSTVEAVNFGLAGDIPVPANFDTDGKADVAVFRPSTGQWYWLLSSNGSFNSVSFGLAGDVPMPADFDGDQKADVNVFRPSNGTWHRINSATGTYLGQQFGLDGDKPILGDFDGDGKSEIAVWRPSTSEWFWVRSWDQNLRYYQFGLPGDIPSVGDFDGDGKSDVSVYRPSNGTWYRMNSFDGNFIAVQYGLPGDSPAPSYYLQ